MTQVRQREAQRIFEAAVARYQLYTEYRDSGIEWLGDIPAHWEVRRLKTIVSLRTSNIDKKTNEDDIPVRLCNYTDVYYNDFITGDMDLMEATATPDQIQKFELKAGDVIITKDSESADDIAVAAFVPHDLEKVVCGYHLALLRPLTGAVEGRYLFRAFSAYPITSQFEIAANGITRYGLSQSAIGDAWFLLPPPDEQRAIAAFLDRQTAKIDALIAKKRELIAALHEKRSAIISHAVTKGLNPDAPMKDSGIEWVDTIPAHWQVQRLKFVADVRSGVAKGRKFEGVKTVELPYLRVANVQAGHIDLSDVAEIEVTVSEIERYCLKVGDVLMNEGGDYDKLGRGAVWQGQIEPCLHQNHVFAVRPYQQSLSLWITTLTLAQYARFYFMINSKQSTNLASISSRNLSEFPVIMPPQSEREQILGYIENETRHIDRLTAKAEETIERLQEYRAALISAAVTGKIDVRGA
jgi:type I restriction enzyme S subunit